MKLRITAAITVNGASGFAPFHDHPTLRGGHLSNENKSGIQEKSLQG